MSWKVAKGFSFLFSFLHVCTIPLFCKFKVLDFDEGQRLDRHITYKPRMCIHQEVNWQIIILLFAASEPKKGKLRKFSDKLPAIVDHLNHLFLC